MEKPINILAGIIMFLLFHSCAKNPVTGRNDFTLMSEQQEIAMGQQSDPEIIKFFGLYEDPALQKFIEEKGQQMASVSHRKSLKYQFKIVDSHVVNAFAVPGGYVYFTRGIMAHFNNEAEFAGVLGHEIGHITARHSVKQYSNAMLAQLGLAAGMVLSPELARYGELAQTGVQLLFLKFDRDAESQSDKLGVEYSTKIGYDAQEMAEFFKTLDRMRVQSGSEPVPTFLSTHPDPADREVKVAKLASDWKKKVRATDLKVNEDKYLKMIDGLVYGEDPKQGYVESNVFYHPVLKFQFPVPSQWTLQNSSEQVQMAPKDGKALMMLTLAQGNSLEDAAQQLITNYKLNVVESRRDDVNSLPALQMVADQQQEQQTIRALIYLIQYGGNIYAILGVSGTNDFRTYAGIFQSTMNNFKVLNDPSKINRQPERIRIKPVPRNATLSQALRSYNVHETRMEELAILNGMKLDEQVSKGKLIKIVN